jgi:hypothetical protein
MVTSTFSTDSRLVLTDTELAILDKFLLAGDRAGFYMAYYAMTGNTEALLTSKISTFSEASGGAALASNWLLQDQYRVAGPSGSSPYRGIYAISQEVA